MARLPARTLTVPTDLLDDIASRFILDAPDSELNDPIALCFLTELAFWFYLDEYVEEDESLNNIKFDPFAMQLIGRCGLKPPSGTIEEMLQDFREFKIKVPTFGGLLLSPEQTHVLLVQGFWHRASWGFPKGKINVDEEPNNCAIREVLEETGYDISSNLDKSRYLETSIGEQHVRLYIICNVPMDVEFVPRTKGEIKALKWFPINQLPAHKNDRTYNKINGSTNMFYMVMPFVKPLREWIASTTRGREGRRRHQSLSEQSSSQRRHNQPSPVTGDSSKKQPLADNNRKHQNMVFTSFIKEEFSTFEKQRKTDSSPRRKENGKRSRKSLFSGPNPDNVEEPQKFTFKNRGKGRNQSSQKGNRDGQSFRSMTWQSFQLNRKDIFDNIEKAWSGVHL